MSNQAMIRVRHPAMGCEFELVLCGNNRDHLVDAAQEAFEEVDRLDQQLSVFNPTSEISYINALAAREPVCVEPRLFRLLEAAARLSAVTEGAFDISTGALIEIWSSAGEVVPSREQIESALAATGMANIVLDAEERTIRFTKPGVRLSLGAIGKGYAAGEIADLLRDRGIESGLVSAGASTVYAIGAPPGEDSWSIGIRNPIRRGERITCVKLSDKALATSGSHQRFVEIDGIRYSHIIDPRTGRPVIGLLGASVVAENPAESDALSTAFFILGIEKSEAYCKTHPGVGVILISSTPDGEPEVVRAGVV